MTDLLSDWGIRSHSLCECSGLYAEALRVINHVLPMGHYHQHVRSTFVWTLGFTHLCDGTAGLNASNKWND